MNELITLVKQYFYFDILDKWGFPILFSLFIIFFISESIRPLRKRRISRWERIKTNTGIAATALFMLRLALLPALVLIARWAETTGIGLLNWANLPTLILYITGFLLLDYGNYLWHVVNHRIPFLWRFHNVHHIDLDLDVTTAVRFHFGEIIFSVFFRGFIILATGAPYILVLVYEIIFEAATNFHHTNWRMPYKAEKALSWIIVTPRMHGIHHSIVQRETNSNYSVIFSCWDRLHRSIRLNIAQNDIDIGVPSYRDPKEQTILNLLLMPFKKQRSWQLPNGEIPDRIYTNKFNHLKE